MPVKEFLVPQRSGRFEEHTISLEFLRDASEPDPMDVNGRLEELGKFEEGWLDGEGKVPSKEELRWLGECFDLYFPEGLKRPYLCLTEDGGIFAEWPSDTANLSLEINLSNRQAHWHELDLFDDSSMENDIDLNNFESWEWFCERIKSKGGIA